GIHSPKECRFRTGARMHKIALTAVASAVILCSGSMVSDRAEAMTLGATAAGVRVAVQDISSVDTVGYRWRRHYHHGKYRVIPNYWWWGAKWWRPGRYVVRRDITFGAYCWRQGIGYGTWVRPCPRAYAY